MGEIGKMQVKVDNWGNFLLQKIHHFFMKDKHSDLTLDFPTVSQKMKVHKLVLYACTDYFQSLSITDDDEDGDCLLLGEELEPDVVIPIINFMYTGRLEFSSELKDKLYDTAIALKMSILAKLIQSHNPPTLTPAPRQRSPPPKQSTSDDTYTPAVQVTAIPSNCTFNTSIKTEESPIVTISEVRPNDRVVSQVKLNDSSPRSGDRMVGEMTFQCKTNKRILTVKKPVVVSRTKVVDPSLPATLPGRKLPIWKRRLPEECSYLDEAKPTRFEWDEDLTDPTAAQPVEDALQNLSHDKATHVLQPIIINDEYKPRPSTSSYVTNNGRTHSPAKRPKMDDISDVKEFSRQQQLRSEILGGEQEDDEEDEDDPPAEDIFSEESSSLISPPKPILKTTVPKETNTKRVRFSLEGKENEDGTEDDSQQSSESEKKAVTGQKIIVPMENSQIIQPDNSHAKIVSEVLKKYPNLARHKNIKLKIMKKGMPGLPITVQQSVGQGISHDSGHNQKVQYVVLKKTPADVWEKPKDLDPENNTGPWRCTSCGSEDEPINFIDYPTFRSHLVNVHQMKIDARICEYCGTKISKRNQLLFHLYTRHNVEPPSQIKFPKCTKCDHVALSESYLQRHMINHDVSEDLKCYVCGVFFRSYGSLQSHLNSEFHASNVKRNSESEPSQPLLFRCPYCEFAFSTKEELKNHIYDGHWTVKKEEPGETEIQNTDASPSSEQEALSNVASGITTSLTLDEGEQNVVYYTNQQTYDESQEINTEVTMSEGGSSQEFIVPDSEHENIEEVEHQQQQEEEVEEYTQEEYTEPQTSQEVEIQQIPSNVIFQPQQRVMLAPGNVVQQLMGQNVVLQQVLPQTRIILSNQIMPQHIDQNTGIIFTNSRGEVQQFFTDANGRGVIVTNQPAMTDDMKEEESTPTEEHMIIESQQVEEDQIEQDNIQEEISLEEQTMRTDEESNVHNTHEVVSLEEEQVTRSEEVENIQEEPMDQSFQSVEEYEQGTCDDEIKTETERVEEQAPKEIKKVDTSKLVDDWDENNPDANVMQKVNEGGPSRAVF